MLQRKHSPEPGIDANLSTALPNVNEDVLSWITTVSICREMRMLRTDVRGLRLVIIWLACAGVGALAAALVWLGNPGNMGICGACFLRDLAGALGLFTGEGPRIVRPELLGLVFGAFLWRLGQRKLEGRAGAFSAARFFLGVWMGIGALVFLGCPFRMLQRIGGGDLNAVVGLAGFIVGVGIGRLFELRGYTSGKTGPVLTPAGSPALILAILVLVLFLGGWMPFGPGPDNAGGPPHAPWNWSLALGLIAGVVLSWTGFCAVSAARQVFTGPRRMLVAAALLVAGYAAMAMATGKWNLGFESQPISHSDHLWNMLAMTLVGLTGVLAGGCPVRQVVLAGEGNGEGLITAMGILSGAALAHSFKMVSTPAGTTDAGRVAVLLGLVICLAYALWVVLAASKARGHATVVQ
jgi:YedE family putative selenium metabolism protein